MSDWADESEVLRAAEAGVSGYWAVTDDAVDDLEIAEAKINPSNPPKKSDSGQPSGALPPMMGGAGQGAGSTMGAAGATSGGLGSLNGVAGTSGGALGSFRTGGVLGTGASGGSLGGLTGTVAAGSEGNDYGFGINPATGRPWSPSDPGFTERFGTYDPKTGLWVNPLTGQSYDPTTGNWHTSVTAGDASATGITGVSQGAVGTGDGGDTSGVTGGVVGSQGIAGLPSGSAPVPGGWGPSPGHQGDHISPISSSWDDGELTVDPDRLITVSRHWDDLSARLHELNQQVDAMTEETVIFGEIRQPRPAYAEAQTLTAENSLQSVSDFGDSASNLHRSATDYQETEQVNTDVARSLE